MSAQEILGHLHQWITRRSGFYFKCVISNNQDQIFVWLQEYTCMLVFALFNLDILYLESNCQNWLREATEKK